MRLFNRRKEMEFDDPRLVGMAPLKATEENFGLQQQQEQSEQQQNLKMVQEEQGLVITGRKSSSSNSNEPHLLQQQDKSKVPNGGVSRVSTWKKVSRPWDSLRRSESTEHLNRSIMSSSSNRRRTLHFYPEFEDKFNKSLPRVQCPNMDKTSCTISSSDPKEIIINPSPTKRKLGRVESLRLLLSKSNRIYRGKNSSSKSDKGTDTQDLDNEPENGDFSFSQENNLTDDVFHSKYSTISSIKSNSSSSSYLPINFSDNKNNILRQLQLTKATSCENLSFGKNNGNQGITLPGHRDMSTSTYPLVSCVSQETSNLTTGAKRSFPYAYIRSRLTSLQEEPKSSPVKTKSKTSPSSTPTAGETENQCQAQKQQKKCSISSKFMHKGFYHSMGNLLTRESDLKDEEEGNRSAGEAEFEDDDADIGGDSSTSRIFDPLKQIRIDLLHKNPSEFDDQSSSPTFWGKRSYSIGDMLEKRKIGKTDSTGVEESGYDSDSTRNGHESPRNSIKSPSSETENESNESDHPVINTTNPFPQTKSTSGQDEGFDSQSQSNSESSSSSSSALSSYSFPASGCLITINRSHPEQKIKSGTSKTINTKNGSSSVVEIVSDETDDFYSAKIDSVLESNNAEGEETAVINHSKMSRNEMECEVNSRALSSKEKCASSKIAIRCKSSSKAIPIPNQLPQGSTTSQIKKETGDSQKQVSAAPSLRLRNRVRDKDREWNGIRPSRSKSLCLSIFIVTFNKGPNKKSLGFSVIGGSDSPVPGIFVKRIFPYGQATEEGGLSEGDEILSVNGQPLANSTHAEALNIFKSIKTGDIVLEVARREFYANNNNQTLKRQYSQLSSKSCEQLYQAY